MRCAPSSLAGCSAPRPPLCGGVRSEQSLSSLWCVPRKDARGCFRCKERGRRCGGWGYECRKWCASAGVRRAILAFCFLLWLGMKSQCPYHDTFVPVRPTIRSSSIGAQWCRRQMIWCLRKPLSFGFRFCHWCYIHPHFGNSVFLHLQHGESAASAGDFFFFLEKVAFHVEQQSGYGFHL